MRKDPTEFRKRFAAWKNGKQPYEAGLPKYEDGKEPYQYEGYNYTYQNKTKSGAKLSIRNGRLYAGDKIVSAGYRWHDGNNGNTYETIGKGKFKLVSTQEGPVKKRSIKSGDNMHYIYKADDNEVNYLKNEVDPEELTGADKLFLYRSDFVNKRLQNEEQYAIPQHLPGVKRRTLSTGDYKGVRVYDNTLDSIFTNSAKNNVSFITGLGLAAETSLGRDKHMHVNKTRQDYNTAVKFPYYNALQNDRYVLFPTDMTNNHNYYVGNNATGTINTLIQKGLIPGIKSWDSGSILPFPVIGGQYQDNNEDNIKIIPLSDKQELIIDQEANKVLKWKERSSDDPWKNTFDFYKSHNYGMGPNYPNDVMKRGISILNTPEIRNYLKYRE